MYFKEELSIENIMLSIRKFKEQVDQLNTKKVYDVSLPNRI